MGRKRMGRTDGRTDGQTRRRLYAPPRLFGEHNKIKNQPLLYNARFAVVPGLHQTLSLKIKAFQNIIDIDNIHLCRTCVVWWKTQYN